MYSFFKRTLKKQGFPFSGKNLVVNKPFHRMGRIKMVALSRYYLNVTGNVYTVFGVRSDKTIFL